MQIRVDRTRMAMNGRFYAYDVTVSRKLVPHVAAGNPTIIVKSGDGKWEDREYVRFEDAFLPTAHYAMELGWERYQDRLRHDEAMKPIMLSILQQAFPELANADKLPELWCELPGFDERHATRFVEYFVAIADMPMFAEAVTA